MNKNEAFEVEIIDMTNEGLGIGKYDGYTLFIKDTVIGDRVKGTVTKAKKNYGYGRVTQIVTPSKDRVTPKCPVARQCGGCQLQAMSYESQLEFKKHKVLKNLEKIGGVTDFIFDGIVGMDDPYHYRNKAQYPVGRDKSGAIITGFYAGRTHSIVNYTDCLINHPVNEQILSIVKQWMEANGVEPYHEADGTGLVRHVLTRVGFTTGQIMVCLIINGSKIPAGDQLVDALKSIPGMTSICLNVNKERTNVILGRKVINLFGEGYIEDTIDHVRFRISPLSFYQVNPIQTEKLYRQALNYAGLTGNEVVWDMYCGIGTISLFLAKNAKKVYGVEIVEDAIKDARINASLNAIDNVEFFVGKAEEVVPDFYEKNSQDAGTHPDVVVVDPPRKGCDQKLLCTMVKMAPQKIVYVSCDSATLARDLKYLEENGYKTERVTAVDQFAATCHVESVVLLSQRKADDYVEGELELDELDLTSTESKATYDEIKEYVLEKHGLKVSSLYISQVKRKCGLDVGQNYNLSKKEDAKVLRCPLEKEAAIMEALKYFQMIH